METYYLQMYVQPWPEAGGLQVGGKISLRFDHCIRTVLANWYCVSPDGTPSGAPPDPISNCRIIDRYGSFAICQFDFVDNFMASWKAIQKNKGAVADESMFGLTLAQLNARMATVRSQWKTFIDNRGIPTAATETQRAVNFLNGLDLTGHHVGFETVRKSYVKALTDPMTAEDPMKLHHWMYYPPIYDPTQTIGPPFNLAVMQEMKAEMDHHSLSQACCTMHFAMEYGAISSYLDR